MTLESSPEKQSVALLRERMRRVFRELPLALAGSEEPIHQLRVAARRLRVTLAILGPADGGKRLQRARRVLRQLTRCVGRGRDLDVLVGLLEDRVASLDAPSREHRALLGLLRGARARSRPQLASAVMDLDIDGLRRSLRQLQRQGPADVGSALARAIAFREAQAAALLRQFSNLGDRLLPDALHAVRRRVRRLRYAAEVEDVLRGEDCRAPALWKRLQEAIGAIHDQHVLSRWLDEQARAAEVRGRQDLARAARAERRFAIGEARKLHAALVAGRPADLALRALDASSHARGRRARRKEGGVDAALDHPPRDRGASRDTGDSR